MLTTSLRVIHRTDRYVVTRFRADEHRDQVFVVEQISPAGKVKRVRALSGALAGALQALHHECAGMGQPGQEFSFDRRLDNLMARG